MTCSHRARREVDDGLLPSCQLTLAKDGETIATATFGDADKDSRYVIFSCTKALVASTVWLLLADGSLKLDQRVADLIPEFATNGKDVVTLEQVLLHTAGFPHAPLGVPDWSTRDRPAGPVRGVEAQLGRRDTVRVPPRRRRTGCSQS